MQTPPLIPCHSPEGQARRVGRRKVDDLLAIACESLRAAQKVARDIGDETTASVLGMALEDLTEAHVSVLRNRPRWKPRLSRRT